MSELRGLPVPDGLEGERVDSALARIFGLSRTKAADLAAGGKVTLDGHPVGKSDRVAAGDLARGRDPGTAGPRDRRGRGGRRTRRGLRRRRRGRGRQAGRGRRAPEPRAGTARRSSAGWPGRATASPRRALPSGRGSSTASTSARAGSWWSRSPSAPTPSSSAPSRSARSRRSTTRSCRGTSTRPGAPSTRRSTGTRSTTTGGRSSPRASPASPTTRPSRRFRAGSLLEIHLETGRTHQIRVHLSALRHPCVGDLTYGADPVLSARLGLERQWLHARRLAFEHPATGERVEFTLRLPGRPRARPRRHPAES